MSSPASLNLMTRGSAAETLAVSLATIDKLIGRGVLSVVRIGRAVRVPESDVRRVVESAAKMPVMGTQTQTAAGRGTGFLFQRRRRDAAGAVRVARRWSYTVAVPGGEAVTVHTPYTRKDLAREAMESHRHRLEAELAGKKGSPWAGLTLEEIVEKIVDRGGLKGSASAVWRSKWKTTVLAGIRAAGWKMPADADEHSWLAAWNGEALAGYSSKYRNEIRAGVRSVLARLEREKIIDRNPIADAPLDQRGDVRSKARALSEAEMAAVLRELPAFERDVVTLAYAAALRKADLRMLRVEWLRPMAEGGMIDVPRGQDKSRRESHLRLASWGWAAAMRLAAGRKAGSLIERSGKWWQETLPATWAAAAKAAGVPAGPRGHVLRIGSVRKTAITRAVELERDVSVAQKFARHADVRLTLAVYAGAGLTPQDGLALRLPPIGGGGRGRGDLAAWTAGRTVGGGEMGGDGAEVVGVAAGVEAEKGLESGLKVGQKDNRRAGGLGGESGGKVAGVGFERRGGVGFAAGEIEGGLLAGLTLREREAVVAFVRAGADVRARVAEVVLLMTALETG